MTSHDNLKQALDTLITKVDGLTVAMTQGFAIVRADIADIKANMASRDAKIDALTEAVINDLNQRGIIIGAALEKPDKGNTKSKSTAKVG